MHPKIPDPPQAAPPPSRHMPCAAPAPVVLSAGRATPARSPASGMVPPRPLMLWAPCDEAQCLSRYKGGRAPPHARHSRRRPPWTLSPLCFRSCSLAQPCEAPNPFLLHHLSSPCCLCPSRAAPLAGAESSVAAATARLHWRTLCPNRALKSIAGEPLGLPHLFPSQVQRSPRRNCGCTAVG
jgi:hypothetical protein